MGNIVRMKLLRHFDGSTLPWEQPLPMDTNGYGMPSLPNGRRCGASSALGPATLESVTSFGVAPRRRPHGSTLSSFLTGETATVKARSTKSAFEEHKDKEERPENEEGNKESEENTEANKKSDD